jgi:hypothetical protein
MTIEANGFRSGGEFISKFMGGDGMNSRRND